MKSIFSAFFIFFGGAAFSDPTICLNMIVKNESEAVSACLASVKDSIDYWVIVDTGSTDGTQNVIREFLKEIPGELHERPWVNFAHNRNEALALAKDKAEYSLFIDADECLRFTKRLPKLDKDFYFITVKEEGGAEYRRIALVKNDLDWEWVGPVHETIQASQAKSWELLQYVVNISDTRKGARAKDPQKYLKDAKILEKELERDPNNRRNVFFLAQSYLNAEKLELALKYYEKRALMGGEEQEIFYAKFMAAHLHERLQSAPEVFIRLYQEAHRFRPSRIEPLFHLAKYYLRNQDYPKAYAILKQAKSVPCSEDAIFVDRWIYNWGVYYYYAECCAQLGKEKELREVLETLLLCKDLPEEKRQKIQSVFFKKKSEFTNSR